MKTKHPRSQPNRQILEEASAWFVDFRIGDIDAGAREEFHRWLQRSPEHIQAYLEIAGTYAELPLPSADSRLDVHALIAHARSSPDDNVIPLQVPGSAISGNKGEGETPQARRRTARVWPAVAASIALATFGAWHYTERGTYTTDIGEQRSLTLADGSTVELNSHSRIRVRYSDHERHIDLIEGQALFHVAKNKARPFIVQTGDTQVRAVGTQFDVYRKRSGTVVTVLEGRVAVIPLGASSPRATASISEQARARAEPVPRSTSEAKDSPHNPETPDSGTVLLAAGEQLIVRPRSIDKPARANIVAATAWTTRQLIFDATPLTEVAEEFNRYSTRRLIIDGQQLGDFHISGTYSSTNPDSLLRFLRTQPGIKLVETDREIHVTRERSSDNHIHF
jgi:transmembrane sensor